MKLALKEKVFSLREAFQVMDEEGNPIYEVIGKLLSVGHKLTVTDMDGQEAPKSTRRSSAWCPSTSSRSTARRRWS